MCPCGLLALICRKHLTELNGRNCGLPWPNMESLHAWFGWCNAFIIINMTASNVERRWVRILKSRQASDKDAFWVLDFFYFRSLNGPCPKKKKTGQRRAWRCVGIDFGGFKCAEIPCFFWADGKKMRIPHGYVHGWSCWSWPGVKPQQTDCFTNEVPPPTVLTTRKRRKRQVKTGLDGHKWLGCILCVGPPEKTKLDGNHHLQAVSGVFYVHRQILCVKDVRIMDRLLSFSFARPSQWLRSFQDTGKKRETKKLNKSKP